MDLGGFRVISWTLGVQGLATCGNLWQRAAAPKGRLQVPILQVCRLGGLDPGGLELEAGWPAGLLPAGL